MADEKEQKKEVKEDTTNEEKKPTPEEEREAKALKLQVTLYEDGQLKIESQQNVKSRALAEYVISRANQEYARRDIANLTAITILDSISRSQKSKRIYVPGEK